MLIMRHRVNSSDQLKTIPSFQGVEIDLRSRKDQVILQHDPFKSGELFEDWLMTWNGQFLILNIKEEGLEERILENLQVHSIENYFFLDQSFPFMQKLIRSGNSRVAARASDIESVQTALSSGATWCWLDSFSGNWDYLSDSLPRLKEANIKTCLVSPELQRPNSEIELEELRYFISHSQLLIDAVCTKSPGSWL